jgi:glycine dehydrogenase subunit 1
MDFISNKQVQIDAMLTALGLDNLEELFHDIPASLKLAKPSVDDGLSEYEGMRLMESIASQNTFPKLLCYLGAGAYEHHVPAIVSTICSKSEFLTSYTSYQPEVSQGLLQAIFEFQSAICALTGMDVANASLYDGATACAEAALLSLRENKERNKIVMGASIHPHYRSIIELYLESHGTQIAYIPYDKEGKLDLVAAKDLIDEQTNSVLLQSPNFFGVIDDVKSITALGKTKGALSILCANPLSYGLYASASELGADIAVGDTQPLGLPLQFGGPYAGYFACTQALLRQMPGRIVGETVDLEGKRGFVLTLQAREQHIRREKATSNICTNQTLAALASLITLLWYGKEGIKKLALTNYQRTAYLKEELEKIADIKMMGNAPFFNEFAFSFGLPFQEVDAFYRQRGIYVGLDIGRYDTRLEGMILACVTETKSKPQLDTYVQTARELIENRKVK